MNYLLIATILKMTLTSSVAILFIFLTRQLLRKSPRIFSYILWFFALFRLLCPISFNAPIAIVPEEISTGQLVMYATSQENRGSLEMYGENFADFYMQLEEVNISFMQILFAIWIIGFFIMMIRSIRSLHKLKKQIVCAMLLDDNVYLADYIESPFVIGLIKPKIYVPSSLSETELAYVLAHEKYHIKRKDYIVKLIGYLALSVHWFNPAVWYMFETMCIDMEMSCDEAVLKKMGEDTKEEYSSTLLNLSGKSRFVSSIPLAFVEGDTKSRIRNILNWKKTTIKLASLAVIICICSGIFTLANPIVPDRTIVKTFEQSKDICRPNEESVMDIWWYEDFQKSFKDNYTTEKELVLDTYHQLADGTWQSYQYYYKYLLVLSGQVQNRPVTLYILSDSKNISFEEACWGFRYKFGQENVTQPDIKKNTIIPDFLNFRNESFTNQIFDFAYGNCVCVAIKYAE